MWETMKNAWRVKELRDKLIYTFVMLVIFRLVGVIPAPGVDIARALSYFGDPQNSLPLLDLVNMMTGNAFNQMTIMAMGITPYINSSIIMQLLTIAIPALERMQKEGVDGRKKIQQITRYVTVGLAVLQAIGLVAGLGFIKSGWWNYALVGISMAGGTALAMWIGERITEKGIGNGVSLLIFAGIISNLFNGLVSGVGGAINGTSNWLSILGVILAALVLIVIVTFVDMGERRVPVQYAKRVVGRKMYGGQSTHIPMKVNSTGVLPLIFAYSFMAFPGTIIQLVAPKSGVATWWAQYMGSGSVWYMIITFLLIIAFTYFYTSISFNPQDIAKNIQQQGGMIPGIRSGKNTVDYLARTSSRLTLFGALFLAILASVPTLLTAGLHTSIPFAASSLLIAVSVALETTRQLESQLVMRHYKGFL